MPDPNNIVRCADCQFWLPALGAGDAGRYISFYDSPHDHYCQRALTAGMGIPDDKTSLAHTLETDMGSAFLMTSPDFGCVQGVRKDA